jgi:DNA polymerase
LDERTRSACRKEKEMLVSIDFETRSLADLQKIGAWAYSEHPSTEILCCAVSIDRAAAVCYDCRDAEQTAVVQKLLLSADKIHAWNVAFEYAMIVNVWKLSINIEKFFDTTAKACAFSLPASLGKCGAALNLSVQKDKEGERLIRLFSVPVSNGSLKGKLRDTRQHEEDFKKFMDYCRMDVEAELAIDAALPDLSDDDVLFWSTTWRTNLRGVPMDVGLIAGLRRMVDRGSEIIGAAVVARTEGVLDGDSVKNNHRKTAQYLELPSVAKPYVKELLQNDLLDAKTREILEARQALGRTAVAKLPKFESYMGKDNRVRFVHRFNGALSGRDTSLGCNFMNLPRGAKFDVPKLVAAAKADNWQEFFEASKYTLGKKGPVPCPFDPLGAVVACLRGCLAPETGVFMQCDYASIEPRMLAWYSGQEWELQAWRDYDAGIGPDLYKVFAAKSWNITPEEVSDDQRQMGKVGKLAAQYRTGAKTLQTQAKDQYALILSNAEAEFLVNGYRATHRENVAFWYNTEEAAKKAIKRPGSVYSVGRAAYRFNGVHLQCKLASGRKITYPYASVELAVMPWVDDAGNAVERECLFYYCEDGKHWKKIQTHGGVLTNHIVQGTSGCLLRYACNNIEKAGFSVVLRVYDELVVEAPDDSRFDEFKRIMLTVPEWAEGMPVNGAGWCDLRYKKD